MSYFPQKTNYYKKTFVSIYQCFFEQKICFLERTFLELLATISFLFLTIKNNENKN